jgi:hypothetical protein
MLGTRWVGLTRKKSSEKHFHTKITDRNYQIVDCKLSLVRSGKVYKNYGPQF